MTATQPRRGRTRAKLAVEVQTFIIQRLAMFDKPSRVAELVKDDFGLEVDRRLVQQYDATRTGEKPARKWVALFEATREAFLERIAGVATAEKAVRVKELDELYQDAKKRRNAPLAAALLKQIAKEVGDAYSNKRRLVGGDPGDAPIGIEFFMPDVPPPVGVQRRPDDDEDDVESAVPPRALRSR